MARAFSAAVEQLAERAGRPVEAHGPLTRSEVNESYVSFSLLLAHEFIAYDSIFMNL